MPDNFVIYDVSPLNGVPEARLDRINAIQAQRGKPLLGESDVICRGLRLTGNQPTTIGTRFKDSDLVVIAERVPGAPVLVGHDTKALPVGVFYSAKVTWDSDGKGWVDASFYMPNDESGRRMAQYIDSGVYNEASMGWTFSYAECTICGKDYNSPECSHLVGETYGEEICSVYTTGDIEPLEGSIVYRGAHPGTAVGGGIAAASHPLGKLSSEGLAKALRAKATPDPEEDSKEDGPAPLQASARIAQNHIPNNPSGYGKVESGSWGRPTLDDFRGPLDLGDAQWEDIPASKRRRIASCFAWAPSDNPDDYTFTELKLPHHLPNGDVSWPGVRAAMSRLSSTEGLGGDAERVRSHLLAHYRDFDKDPPTAAEPDGLGLPEKEKIMEENTPQEAPPEVTALYEMLYRVSGIVEGIAARVDEISKNLASASSEWSQIGIQAAETPELKASIVELKNQLAKTQKLSELGIKHLNEMAEEAVALRISLEGPESADAYEEVVKTWAETARADALESELARLRSSKAAAFPSGRLSTPSNPNREEEDPAALEAFSRHPKNLGAYTTRK